MLTYDTVTDPGFRHMLHTFEPRYVPPDETTIARHYIPLLYEREKAKVTSAMASGLQLFAIASDGWSSRANHSYVSLTVHYISEQWETSYHLLETAESTTDHTAVNLATGLEEVLARWQLPLSKLSGATTDNARNITAALEILGWQQLGCFAHTLQLGVHKAMALPEMIRALGRAKRLVGHFHHSVKSTNVLRQKQKDLRHELIRLYFQIGDFVSQKKRYLAFKSHPPQTLLLMDNAPSHSSTNSDIYGMRQKNPPVHGPFHT